MFLNEDKENIYKKKDIRNNEFRRTTDISRYTLGGNMRQEIHLCWSIIIKIIVVICFCVGFTMSYLYGHVNGITNLLYFTNQSNIWIALFDFIIIFYMMYLLLHKRYEVNHIVYKIQQVLTVCISITGLVYNLVLVPAFYLSNIEGPTGYTPFSLAAVLLHIVVPILSVFDFFMFTRHVDFKYKDSLYSLIPTGYYFIFSLIGYLLNWDFGDGRNYPYFFLNYDSPAGIFGFSNTMPYFMGTFYWIILLSGITIGLSALIIKLIKIIIHHRETHHITNN